MKINAQTVEDLHLPVLRDRIVELLTPALQIANPVALDCTLGLGGHAIALLSKFPNLQLIGIDRDQQGLAIAAQRLADFENRIKLFHGVYHELAEILELAEVSQVNAIVMDLGLSSLQIDETSRGFAYATDVALDMRMDQESGRTAADLLNESSEAELVRILFEYGDERNARRISRAIVASRELEPFQRSAQLVKVIEAATPGALRGKGHPAKRSFQALRIAVNGELDSLRAALPKAITALAAGGRLAVLAYHSGEDRLVKQAFAQATADRVPLGLPSVPTELAATHVLLTRGAERPSAAEIAENPRAASARMRAIERKGNK